ncbi:MAG: response regulator [Gemmatimonadaceae bacterium]
MTPANPRILIVDDERQNRQLLEVLLAPEGYLLDTASSAEEALLVVSRQRPDLILLDVMMPGMDGYQLVARLKANADTATIPVILLTALDDRNSRSHGLTAGATAFLTKPVDRHALTATIRNLLASDAAAG